MPKHTELFRRAIHLGPRLAAEKGCELGYRKLGQTKIRLKDYLLPSFSSSVVASLGLKRYVKNAPQTDAKSWPVLRAIAELHLEHRFDLLGSGWQRVRHGMKCGGVDGHRYDSGPAVNADAHGNWLRGRINHANLSAAQSIWQTIEGDYQPIDWHLDFKSGYRWREDTWHAATPFGHLPGVDIKVPWELSRMQHLPQMALAVGRRQTREDTDWAARVQREFRNQVLDFMACNPPRFGVNWRCAMDVGIRAANWLLAYDLFRAGGMPHDERFDSIFATSIFAHGKHLVENLEWHRLHRGNHYLANVTGLLFIAAHLPCSPQADAWLAFAVRQLVMEIPRQFTSDGANFEASTSYHRLSAEMAVFGAAIILALDEQKLNALASYNHHMFCQRPYLESGPVPMHPLPFGKGTSPLTPDCWQRLSKMAEFSRDVTKFDGTIHQVGDNDSGRFIKLFPTFLRPRLPENISCDQSLADCGDLDDPIHCWRENHLDHRALIAALGALLERQDLLKFAGKHWPEAQLIQSLTRARNTTPSSSRQTQIDPVVVVGYGHTDWQEIVNALSADENLQRREFRIQLPPGILDFGLSTRAYPDFGLFIWRNERIYLAVRCGPIGQEGNGGHAHNDQLAIELQVDGEDWLVDPGTYLYTANPERRNAYRSVSAHFAPQLTVNAEPGRLDIGLFQLGNTARAKCQVFNSRGFVGLHRGYGVPVYRAIQLVSSTVIVRDYIPKSHQLRPIFDIDGCSAGKPPLPISHGYGLLRAA
jgi:hypothetical protein